MMNIGVKEESRVHWKKMLEIGSFTAIKLSEKTS